MDKIFKFRGKEYRYVDMTYNYTSLNERRVELPIAFEFVDGSDKNVIEIGNVLRHYRGDYFHDVLDLNEKSLWPTIKENVLQWEPEKKYSMCVSISTVEHTSNPLLAVRRILTFAPRVLITFPIGQNCEVNRILDRLENIYFMKRINKENEWIETTREEARKMKYNIPFKWANAIAVLIK